MKRLFTVTLCIVIFTINAVSQVYKATTLQERMAPAILYKQAHDEVASQISELIEYVINILSQDIDDAMRDDMNSEFRSLQALAERLAKYGLSQDIRASYATHKSRIQKKVVEYNNRIANRRVEERERHREDIPKSWSGSGFALTHGYVVTNWHVVENATHIALQGVNGDFNTELNAKVIASDKYNDIAILKIQDPRFAELAPIPYSVKFLTSDVGKDVFVLGYPLVSTMGEEIKLTTGVISSKTGYQGDVSLYQISAAVQPGNSGGPLFDGDGNLIGIVSSKHKGAENVSYAIKSIYLLNLLESVLDENVLPQNNMLKDCTLSEKVKHIKNFVFYIKCKNNETSTPVRSSSPSVQVSKQTSTGPAKNKGPRTWLVPSKPDVIDLESYLSKHETIYLQQQPSLEARDTVYFYLPSPISSVRYKCIIEGVKLPYTPEMDIQEEFYKDSEMYETIKKDNKFMKLKLITISHSEALNLPNLQAYGVTKDPKACLNLSHAIYANLRQHIQNAFTEDAE